MIEKPHPPKLEDFGLNQEQIEFFKKEIQSSGGWVVVVSVVSQPIFLGIFYFLFNERYFFIFYILSFISGGLILISINSFRKWFNKKRKIGNRNYPKYLEYEREYEIYLSQLREYSRMKQEEERKQEEEKRKQIKWWNDLSGYRFEKEVTSFLRGKGYDVEHTGQCGDGGVDIIMNNDGRKIIIQCKRYKSQISPHTLRDLYGTITSMEVDEGWVITTSRFSSGSINFSHGKPIRLLTIQDMLDIPGIKK